MKVKVSSRGAEGLASRLGARALTQATERVAARGAAELARQVAQATGARATVSGSPTRPVVRVSDPDVVARLRGDGETPADPVLDRVRLGFRRSARSGGGQ